MNKQQYLTELKQHLASLSSDEQNDILRDMEEHFREASNSNRTEESVIQQLGTPKAFADMMVAETKVNRIQNAETVGKKLKALLSATLTILVLAPFNLIFVLLPLLFITFFIGMGCFTVFMFFLSVPFALLAPLIVTLLAGFHIFLLLTILFLALGWLGVIAIVAYGFYFVLLAYIKMVTALFSWNINFIKKSMRS